jgi:hypothetical protein
MFFLYFQCVQQFFALKSKTFQKNRKNTSDALILVVSVFKLTNPVVDVKLRRIRYIREDQPLDPS